MQDRKKLIVIDPGHGRFGNKHTTSEGYYEGTQNYILAAYLKKYLEDFGFSAMLTRKTIDDDPSLQERGYMAGENKADMFISLHSDAPGNPTNEEQKRIYPTIRGAVTIYSLSDAENNAILARLMQDTVVSVMNTKDRGILTREYPDRPGIDYYGVLRYSAESGCKRALIIEHGFHTNPEDCAFLEDEKCLDKLALAEAKAINRYFSEICI